MIVDFYVLKEDSGLKSLHFACQLIEKAYQEQQQVYVHTSSQEEAERIDQLLWTFKDDSFIPHHLYQADDTQPPPVRIGFDAAPPHADLLINLCDKIPAFYQNFGRVIEIVFNDPTVQQSARERFKQYREQQCEINTIKN